jgi:hypothetical protein
MVYFDKAANVFRCVGDRMHPVQEYITPRPHGQAGPALVKRPAPLTAADTAACYGPGATESAVHEASRLIRKITELQLWQIGDWMVKCGILLPEHNIDIPHTWCGHRKPSPPR